MQVGLTRREIGALCLALLVMAGCSSDPIAMSTQPVAAYPHRQTLGGVNVAIEPFFTREQASAAFPGGEVFEEQELLLVRVLIENGGRQAIRADHADFQLIRANGQRDVALSPQDAFAMVKPPVGWWAALPILGSSAAAYRNSDWLKQFESRALKSTPVPPDGSAAGLVYFYFPGADKDLAGTRVAFVLKADSGEERSFEIALRGRRDIPGPRLQAEPSRPATRTTQPQQAPARVDGAGGGVIIRSPAQ
jgi:hypothetical protein